jgi:hypothetical protein
MRIFTMRSQLGCVVDQTDITMQPYLCVTVYEYYVAFLRTKIGKFRGLNDVINPTKFLVSIGSTVSDLQGIAFRGLP